jgi:hypothetical protein
MAKIYKDGSLLGHVLVGQRDTNLTTKYLSLAVF